MQGGWLDTIGLRVRHGVDRHFVAEAVEKLARIARWPRLPVATLLGRNQRRGKIFATEGTQIAKLLSFQLSTPYWTVLPRC